MKYSELSNDSIKQILVHLQYLVDGNFNHTGDIMSTTGCAEGLSKEILSSIQTLKMVDFYEPGVDNS